MEKLIKDNKEGEAKAIFYFPIPLTYLTKAPLSGKVTVQRRTTVLAAKSMLAFNFLKLKNFNSLQVTL